MDRIGRIGDGWLPQSQVGEFPGAKVEADLEHIGRTARAAGRDPAAIGMEARMRLDRTPRDTWGPVTEAWRAWCHPPLGHHRRRRARRLWPHPASSRVGRDGGSQSAVRHGLRESTDVETRWGLAFNENHSRIVTIGKVKSARVSRAITFRPPAGAQPSSLYSSSAGGSGKRHLEDPGMRRTRWRRGDGPGGVSSTRPHE